MGSSEQRRPVVVLYERIVDAVQAGTYPPGSVLPSEPRLAAELGVSRPALREALLLLQEDGLLNVRRGVGRTVATRPPRRGFERLRPLEDLLGPVRVTPLVRTVEEPTDFTTQQLLTSAGAQLAFWESMLTGEGPSAVHTQEWAAPAEVLAGAHPAFAQALAEPAPGTMLSCLTGVSRGLPLTGHSALSATLLGRRRGEQLGRPADTAALLVIQSVRIGDVPVMAAKYTLPTGSSALPVLQTL
ncbi:GntR family transcriptional regulator [Streptomyces sp. VRA16 Mangrove soil]|uniref:GntR family transcriptional regulator n=1 Tax=Streptomyces sp. VRA16 Mangrove soil TaxID=2817434 RepID=UPI001A9D1F7F|nr:GntR family transcriptional regulator [Streptomyces sp. VRA16 Mangrove soil]MBO1336054.1 GntR family transcriptional regulator [Streptomyces sp. VRA16 Mangrove soil]